MVMMRTNPIMVSPLHVLSQSIKEGYGLYSEHLLWMNQFPVSGNGFRASEGSVVDVGGGTGVAISEIVKAFPHVKGINLDLPHVISTAPMYDGVTHVSGDMFKAIPNAETIFMKVKS
ncbi:(R,S)-reticuline 7-O-methyltransferase [Tanacetum coccineum]